MPNFIKAKYYDVYIGKRKAPFPLTRDKNASVLVLKDIFPSAPSSSTPATVTPTGVSAVSALGDEAVKGKGLELVTGLSSSSALGDEAAKGKGLKLVTGVSSTTSLGDETPTGKGRAVVTGVSGTINRGITTPLGKGKAIATGLSASIVKGTTTNTGQGKGTLTGLPSTSSIGSSVGKGKGLKSVSGLSGAAALGTVVALGVSGVKAYPTGLLANTILGSLTAVVGKGRVLVAGVSTGGGGSGDPVITGTTSKVYYDSRHRISRIVKTITQEV